MNFLNFTFRFFLAFLFFKSLSFADQSIISSPSQFNIWESVWSDSHPILKSTNCTARITSKTLKVSLAFAEVVVPMTSSIASWKPGRATVMITLGKSLLDKHGITHAEARIEAKDGSYVYQMLKMTSNQDSDQFAAVVSLVDQRIDFIENLKRGTKLVVQLKKNNEPVETIIFSLRGSSVAIQSLVNTCFANLNF